MEACGLFAVRDGEVTEVYETPNSDRSATGYTIPPESHFAALQDAEARGWEIGGVFHSHPAGPATPSESDVTGALDPWWVYLVVGLRGRPDLRAWRMRDDEVFEVALI